IAITMLCTVIYIMSQQSLRISANDPQIQLAQDVASALAAGSSIDQLMPAMKIDIGTSLAPFVVVYDDAGNPVKGNGFLHDQLPQLPSGVFNYTRSAGEDRITWQTEQNIRVAAVIVSVKSAKTGFVMAGRSLFEVERRIDQMTLMVGLGWAGTLAVSLVVIAAVELLFRERQA
ncbi:MAG TPA: hypothetical protein VGK87_13295, partial [Anaerolineae bacterium]